jgi:outer membrane immunogenic protein
MKKLLIGSFLALASISAASAADMVGKAAAVPARPVCAAAQWSGLYLGINGGAASHNAHRQDVYGRIMAGFGFIDNVSSWGGTAGGQIGYNVVNCSTFWGVEVDGAWLSNNGFILSDPLISTEIGGLRARLDGVVTLRGRGGVAFDNMLLYVTGGAAALHTRTNYSHIHSDTPVNEQVNVNDWTWGWVAGFGAEYAISSNLSLRSEFLYIGNTDKQYKARSFGTFSQHLAFNHRDNVAIARVGLNYRFGGPAVAK